MASALFCSGCFFRNLITARNNIDGLDLALQGFSGKEQFSV